MDSESAFFRVLPQEIRDQIYDYAFASEFDTSKIMWRSEWKEREMHNRRLEKAVATSRLRFALGSAPEPTNAPSYEIKRFPGSPLHSMIVSKRFYREASTAWFHGAKLEFEANERLEKFISECDRSLLPSIRTVYVTWSGNEYSGKTFVSNLRRCGSLRRLRVTVKDGINLFANKADFIDDLDEQDFKGLQFVIDILRTTSIVSLELSPGEHMHAETPQEAEQFRKNLASLREYILKQLQARRELEEEKMKAFREREPQIKPSGPSISLEHGTSRIAKASGIDPRFGFSVGTAPNNLDISFDRFINDQRTLESQPCVTPRITAVRRLPRLPTLRVPTKEEIVGGMIFLNTVWSLAALYIVSR